MKRVLAMLFLGAMFCGSLPGCSTSTDAIAPENPSSRPGAGEDFSGKAGQQLAKDKAEAVEPAQ